jgi:ATP-dependent RNA helicase RhlE
LRQLTHSVQKDPRVLIVVPTRELVTQLTGEIRKLTKYMDTRVEGVYGGTNINTQKDLILRGVDVLVGTPGRLMDLALSRILLLKRIKHLIIDEVDEMLGLGFRPQLTTLFDLLPEKRQNLMFSATMSEEVDALIQVFFNNPSYVEIIRPGTPLEKIEQRAYAVPNFNTKLNLLTHLLATATDMEKVLIFGNTKKSADRIYNHLEKAFPEQFNIVHGNKSQNFRMNAVSAFEKGLIRGLIATDILARGLDVSNISHVLNIDTPEEPHSYIHRIGRTGRADSIGASVALVAPYEENKWSDILQLMEKDVPVQAIPEEVRISTDLIPEEMPVPVGKNIDNISAVKKSNSAFHEKTDKNKKVNLGNKTKHLRDKKYKKPIKKRAKR